MTTAFAPTSTLSPICIPPIITAPAYTVTLFPIIGFSPLLWPIVTFWKHVKLCPILCALIIVEKAWNGMNPSPILGQLIYKLWRFLAKNIQLYKYFHLGCMKSIVN